MTEFICPLCQNDLGPAMDVLEDFMGVWDMHMNFHIREDEREIWTYLTSQKGEIPEKLQKMVDNRGIDIRQLCHRKTSLEMMIEDGSL